MILDYISNIDISTSGVEKLIKFTKDLNLEHSISVMMSKQVNEAEILATLTRRGYETETVKTAIAEKAKSVATGLDTKSTIANTIATKAATVARLAFNTALTFGVAAITSLVATGFIKWLYDTSTKEKEAAEAARNMAQEFENNSNEIDNYAEKYDKLHSELTNFNTTEERQAEIKKELLDIQTSLNDKYGEEYEKVNLVTGAYEDQIKAIENIKKTEAQDFLIDNKDQIEKATEKMEEIDPYSLGSFNPNSKLSKDIQEIAKKYNIELLDGAFGKKSLSFIGNAEDAKNTITEFKREIGNLYSDLDKIKDEKDIKILDNILGKSSDSLENAKEIISDYGDTYNESVKAQIINDEVLSKSYTDLVEKSNAYKEAVESGDEAAITKARKEYDEIIKGIDWKGMSEGVRNYFIEVKNATKTGVQDFRNYLTSEGKGLLDPLRGMSADELRSMKNDGLNGDAFDTVIESAKDYGLELEDIISILEDLDIIQKQVVEDAPEIDKAAKIKKQISSINELSEGFESLDKIMNSMTDKDKPFDYALLDDKKFNDNFKGYTEEYNNFIETVSNSPKDINACQSAYNKLVDAYVSGSEAMNVLSDETADLTIDMLKNMGVSNAQEVVMDALAQKHAEAAWTANNLREATAEEIIALANETEATESTRTAFKLYIAEKLLAELAINPNGDIEALDKIVQSLGIATSAWKNYYRAKAELDAMNNAVTATYSNGTTWKHYTYNGVNYAMTESEYQKKYAKNEQLLKESEDDNKELQDQIKNLKKDNAITNYTGGTKTNTPDSGSGSSKDKETIDWIERKLEIIDKKREELNNRLDSETTSYLNSIGLNEEEANRSLELLDKFNSGIQLTDEELAELNSYSTKVGISINGLYDAIVNADFNTKQSAIAQLLEADKYAIETSKQAVEQYRQEFERLKGLVDEETLNKIMFGGDTIDYKQYTSEEKDNIDIVKDAWDKLSDSKLKVEQEEDKYLDDIQKGYQNQVDYLEHQNNILESRNSLINSQIDYMEATGQLVNASTYQNIIANLQQQEKIYEQMLAARKAELAELLLQEGIDENDPRILSLKEQILDVENNIASSRAEQAKMEYEQVTRTIDMMSQLSDMYDDIAQSIENYGAELEASGKELGADYYQTLIDNGEKTINQLQEQADTIRDMMDNYNVGSDNWNNMYNQLQDINSEISSIVQNMHQWNEEMLNIPLNSMNTLKDQLSMMSDALSRVQEDHKTVIDTVLEAIDREKEKLQENADKQTEAIQSEIDKKQEQLDMLEEENNKLKLQQNLEKALLDLENAVHQKTVRVIRDGQVTYEADMDNIISKQEAVQDAIDAINKDKIQSEIDDLNDEIDSITENLEEELKKFEDIASKWEDIQPDREFETNSSLVDKILGEGWEDKVLNGTDEEIYEYLKDQFNQNSDLLDKYDQQIQNVDDVQKLVEYYIEQYRKGNITQQEAMSKVKDVLNNITGEITSGENVMNIINALATSNKSEATANGLLDNIKNQLTDTSKELLESLEVYENNSNTITGYMSSFEDLTDNINDIRDYMPDIIDAIEDGFDSLYDHIDDLEDNIHNRYDDDDEEELENDISNGVIDAGDGKGNHDNSADYGPAFGTNDPSWGRSNSTYDDSADGDLIDDRYERYRYKYGIEKGAIGTSDDDKIKAIKEIATTKLKSDEQPIIAHKGEVILNKEQQDNIVSHMKPISQDEFLKYIGAVNFDTNKLYQSAMPTIPNLNIPMHDFQQRTWGQNIDINIGDINLPDVKDVDGFAKAMGKRFGSLMKQELGKM